MVKYISHTVEDTRQLAEEFAQAEILPLLMAGKCVVVYLHGQLGAGKTAFAQGLAIGLGVQAHVRSPSYSYISEYPFIFGGKTYMLIHADGWRLDEGTSGMIGVEEYLLPGNILVVEWGEKLPIKFTDVGFFAVNIVETGVEDREITITQQNESKQTI